MCNYKQLRNCKAVVCTNGLNVELISYSTPVACLGYIEGEVVDDYGVVYDIEDYKHVLLLSEDYDCSNTTMQHVRAFIEDYIGMRLTIAEIRQALNSADHYLCNACGGIYVYRASWAS